MKSYISPKHCFILNHYYSPFFWTRGNWRVGNKGFSDRIPWIYPYEYVDYQSEHIFLSHQPALRVSRGEFVHLWKSEKEITEKECLPSTIFLWRVYGKWILN